MKKITGALLGCMILQQGISQHNPAMRVNIDLSRKAQTIHNFAASDAWSCQFTGTWPDPKRNQLADWLFSSDTTANGQPKGIGLSMWRFNIGAGSAEQGSESGIRDEWRRAACFLGADHQYHWQQQAGQIWFLNAAKARGVQQFLGFLNSPPVAFTRNGKAFASNGQCNLPPEQYPAVANFLKNVVQGIQQETGITLDFVSPVNEPQWDWSDGGQEGCPYNNEQIYGLVKAVDQTFHQHQLPTKILITEAGKINYLYAGEDKPAKGMQIAAFFDPHSPTYLGNRPSLYKAIAGHSYFTTSPQDTAVAIRKRLHASLMGIPFWQSEYCILGDNAGEMNGNKVDLGMDAALYLARVIHTDLAVANASAWQWWLAISPYDYKDGLIYIDKNKADGQIHDTKMLWVFGNYSRFVRPGAQRVSAQLADSADTKDIYLSAYKNTNNSIAIVVINSRSSATNITVRGKGLPGGGMRSYTTNNQGNLQPGNVNGHTITIPARSVVTLTQQLNANKQ
ncbi:glycoside hydrolase family 30 protein [Chitinophaga sp. Ak27]|uniref:glycoside hydrolase family 30 protein n=1 Tax=Chitinophaga sp. Ak27 TaxID=2726116 RepID=UPI00145D0E17|nr:glycoside hydrolase family 30 protein [Chitinophaga sp. Ak27]NLU92677.1 glycoside hydrolase family 30 protein [Chitinophaga sp. Ak27]